MKKSLTLLGVFLASIQPLSAQDRMHYREFHLGSDVATIVRLIDAAAADVKVVHQRPAVMQNLEWRPRYSARGASAQTDPVELVVFSFYDGQLFKVMVDYDRHRTEGMTDADMIDAIVAEYGPASRIAPAVKGARTQSYDAPDAPVAIWSDKESSVTLMRAAYPASSFRLIVAFTALDTLARTAGTEAVRLDAKEAPQREIARQKKESDEALAALRKAKDTNKAAFRP